jgi:hypothetical protein
LYRRFGNNLSPIFLVRCVVPKRRQGINHYTLRDIPAWRNLTYFQRRKPEITHSAAIGSGAADFGINGYVRGLKSPQFEFDNREMNGASGEEILYRLSVQQMSC